MFWGVKTYVHISIISSYDIDYNEIFWPFRNFSESPFASIISIIIWTRLMIILPLMLVIDGKVLIPPNIGGKVIILNWTNTFYLEVWLYVITGSKNKETRPEVKKQRNSLKFCSKFNKTGQKCWKNEPKKSKNW